MKEEDREGSEWLGLTLDEKITFMKERGMDESAFYTIADVWGWTWEQEIRDRVPEDWSQEKEVQLAIEIMLKVGRFSVLSAVVAQKLQVALSAARDVLLILMSYIIQ